MTVHDINKICEMKIAIIIIVPCHTDSVRILKDTLRIVYNTVIPCNGSIESLDA